MAEQIGKLEAERHDLGVEADRAAMERAAAEESMQLARDAMDALRRDRAAREVELVAARSDRDERTRDFRTRERDLAGVIARLGSLEELDAARAEYGDGARVVLAESQDDVSHMGSVADYLDVDGQYERAVEACLGELLQHVVVWTHEQAAAGLQFARARDAGRVGFVIAGTPAALPEAAPAASSPAPGLTPLSAVVTVSGPAAESIRAVISHAWIADTFEAAQHAAHLTGLAIATREGEVFRGPHVVEGGARAGSRGILTTKREIKELRERADAEREAVERLREQISTLDAVIGSLEAVISELHGNLHTQEKAVVGFDLQVSSGRDTLERIRRKQEQIAHERRAAEEELRAQEARQDEARESIARIEVEQRAADELLNSAQRRLFEAREAMQAQARRTSEAKAAHAALVERAGALAIEVQRLEEAARELESRVATRQEDLRRTHARRTGLLEAIAASEERLDAGLRSFDELRERVRTADEASQELRAGFEEQEQRIRDARRSLETVRAEAGQLEVTRATAEADLAHLASSCVDSVQASLDEVAAEVAQLERDGLLASPKPVDDAPDAAEVEGEPVGATAQPSEESAASPGRAMTPDEMAADLRTKIENMGAVNMMAIDQFDDLESRHAFLTAQRKDLV
ncbi:MAG TPA: hypothetical protein VM733_11530, partial [Thermoanaerobaculia bacterium]|nr:hypothetical protein [Thermoanaerobaculia bacterium]